MVVGVNHVEAAGRDCVAAMLERSRGMLVNMTCALDSDRIEMSDGLWLSNGVDNVWAQQV